MQAKQTGPSSVYPLAGQYAMRSEQGPPTECASPLQSPISQRIYQTQPYQHNTRKEHTCSAEARVRNETKMSLLSVVSTNSTCPVVYIHPPSEHSSLQTKNRNRRLYAPRTSRAQPAGTQAMRPSRAASSGDCQASCSCEEGRRAWRHGSIRRAHHARVRGMAGKTCCCRMVLA